MDPAVRDSNLAEAPQTLNIERETKKKINIFFILSTSSIKWNRFFFF